MGSRVFAFGLLLALATAPVAQAGSMIGVAPASVSFEGGGEGLLREATATRTLSIQNQGDETAQLSVSADGDAAGWLTLETDNLTIAPEERSSVDLTVQVPSNAANGDYEAEVRVEESQQDSTDRDGASSSVGQATVVPVEIQVTDDQTLRVAVDGANLPAIETGDELRVSVDVANDGNVNAEPIVDATLHPEQGSSTLYEASAELTQIAPSQGGTQTAKLDPVDLEPGTYRAEVTVRLPGGEVAGQATTTQLVDVVPENSLSQSGSVLAVETEPGSPGNPVPVRVTFENTGQASVSAKLDLEIRHGGSLVDVVDGDPLEVAPGETATLTEFFETDEAGSYQVTGNVVFGDQRAQIPATDVDVQAQASEAGASADESTDPSDSGAERSPIPAPGLAGLLAVLGAAGVARRWTT